VSFPGPGPGCGLGVGSRSDRERLGRRATRPAGPRVISGCGWAEMAIKTVNSGFLVFFQKLFNEFFDESKLNFDDRSPYKFCPTKFLFGEQYSTLMFLEK
jgi:hypothetical protein